MGAKRTCGEAVPDFRQSASKARANALEAPIQATFRGRWHDAQVLALTMARRLAHAAKSSRPKSPCFCRPRRPRFRIKSRGEAPPVAARRCGGLPDGFHEYVALDRSDRRRASAVRPWQDFRDDGLTSLRASKPSRRACPRTETAKVEPPKTEPVKTLDHQQPGKRRGFRREEAGRKSKPRRGQCTSDRGTAIRYRDRARSEKCAIREWMHGTTSPAAAGGLRSLRRDVRHRLE